MPEQYLSGSQAAPSGIVRVLPERKYVWLVEQREYDYSPVPVASETREGALAALKARYGAPYIVEWSDVEPWAADGSVAISGSFAAVAGLSTKHVTEYVVYRVALE